MQAVFVHISSLVGVIAFLGQMLRFASIERTIITAVSSALLIYVILTFTSVFTRRILAQNEAQTDSRSKETQEHLPSNTEPAPAA